MTSREPRPDALPAAGAAAPGAHGAHDGTGHDAGRARSAPPATSARRPLTGHPIWQITLTRMREIYRRPSTIFWVYVFPVFVVIALGVAFRSRPPQPVPVDVVDTPAGLLVAEVLRAASAVDASAVDAKDDDAAFVARFHTRLVSQAEAARGLKAGRSAVVVRADAIESDAAGPGGAPDGSAAVASLCRLRITYSYDPTRPDSKAARDAVDEVLERAAGRRDVLAAHDRQISEPGGRYIDFLVPGLLGAAMMSGGMWGIGFVAVDMRVRNLLKRMITTPMKKSHFLTGLILSRFVFTVSEVLVVLLFARWLFEIAVEGSWPALLVVIGLGCWTFAGVGLVAACRVRTLETATGVMNLVMLPMWILSGIFFSAERFPAALQPLIQALPLTPLINALRAVMMEGATLAEIPLELGLLLAWSIGTFLVALRFFRWQ